MTIQRKTALVTGASGGIGYEFAKILAKNGYDLVLVARNQVQLEKVAAELREQYHADSRIIVKDLGHPDAAQAVYDEVTQAGVQIETLINNAGFTVYGPFTETALEQELSLMQTNMVTLTLLTKLFVKEMVKRKAGHILNVASTAAFMPGPLMAVYYASKAYVLSFSEALAEELAGTGVTVTCLCPGPTQTGFQARGQMEDSKLVKGRELMTAEEVVRQGYAALQSGKRIVIPGNMNKVQAMLPKFTPRKMLTRAVKNAQARAEH